MPVEERKNTNTKELTIPVDEAATALGITVAQGGTLAVTVERGDVLLFIVTEPGR